MATLTQIQINALTSNGGNRWQKYEKDRIYFPDKVFIDVLTGRWSENSDFTQKLQGLIEQAEQEHQQAQADTTIYATSNPCVVKYKGEFYTRTLSTSNWLVCRCDSTGEYKGSSNLTDGEDKAVLDALNTKENNFYELSERIKGHIAPKLWEKLGRFKESVAEKVVREKTAEIVGGLTEELFATIFPDSECFNWYKAQVKLKLGTFADELVAEYNKQIA